ncbi:MAG TPA: cation transporter [Nitrososphaeraceae archaeon]
MHLGLPSNYSETIEARGKKLSMGMILTEFQESKDPTILTVMVEDSAALLGIVIAAIGLYISDVTGNTIYDALSSVAIGIVLMLFAFFLAKENRGLLIGEAISRKHYNKIIESVLRLLEVNRVITLRTIHFGPKDVLVAMEVSLADNMNTDGIELVIDAIEERVRQVLNLPTPSKIYVEVESDSSPFRLKRYSDSLRGNKR